MKKNLELVLPPMLFVLLVAGLVSAETKERDVLAYIPASSDLAGWSLSDPPRTFVGDGLFDFMNGGADLYLEYGFRQVAAAKYGNKNEKTVQLEIYEMADSSSAYGIYTSRTGDKGKGIDVGNEGKLYDYYLMFWKGNFLVTLTGDDSTKETRDEIVAIARAVDKKISNKGQRPLLSDLLLKENLDALNVKYVKGSIGLSGIYTFDYKNIFGLTEGVVGNYGDHKVFLFKYDNENERQKWFLNASEKIKNNSKFSDFVSKEDTFSVRDRKQNNILCKTHSNYILIVLGAEKTKQNAIIDRLVKKVGL